MEAALELICDFVNREQRAPEVREAIRTLLRANNGIEEGVERAAQVLDDAGRRAGLRVGFSGGALVFRGRDPILVAVAEAMADGSWSRLKACRADDCKWAFVDMARNRSRQWCEMAVCGNREKARRFRSRHA
jgi:predicted RNA-binding Zn ribbon-like protein